MQDTPQRRQNTIARSVKVSGFGLFGGADVELEFCPAPPGHGIVFERVDLHNRVQIPALIDFVIPQPRCTVISRENVSVHVIEHVMAALAGLQIDNCLVRLDAPEPPIGDGSSLHFVDALIAAGTSVQDELRERIVIEEPCLVTEGECVGVGAQAPREFEYEIGFIVDYGCEEVPRQTVTLQITPEIFLEQIASCRTFVLEREVQALQSAGVGLRATPQNVLVLNHSGPIENELRFANECARHKLLDCLGDFALIGCDLHGRFAAAQSGHRLNHAIIKKIAQQRVHSSDSNRHTLAFPGRTSSSAQTKCRAAG